jgi:hypothetical protein
MGLVSDRSNSHFSCYFGTVFVFGFLGFLGVLSVGCVGESGRFDCVCGLVHGFSVLDRNSRFSRVLVLFGVWVSVGFICYFILFYYFIILICFGCR